LLFKTKPKKERTMKQVVVIVIAFIVGISLFSCEGDKSMNNNGGPASQLMHVYADRCQYWNEAGDSLITATIVGGVVLGDPLPRFDYVEVNDRVFAGDDYCTYYEGYCSFGSFG
jgi:hypothetical protein